MVGEIRVMHGPTGLFVSFPGKKQRDGTHRELAYPVNAKTRNMIQQAILAEYERMVPDPVQSENRRANPGDMTVEVLMVYTNNLFDVNAVRA